LKNVFIQLWIAFAPLHDATTAFYCFQPLPTPDSILSSLSNITDQGSTGGFVVVDCAVE